MSIGQMFWGESQLTLKGQVSKWFDDSRRVLNHKGRSLNLGQTELKPSGLLLAFILPLCGWGGGTITCMRGAGCHESLMSSEWLMRTEWLMRYEYFIRWSPSSFDIDPMVCMTIGGWFNE